ncbi:MAG: ferritin [Spirochaetales bacterium]|nr:MAG: ferritin [Spirochaetales bacterium]
MINEKVRNIMNEQIKHELESYYVYLSMAAWFHSQDLDGMGHWMRVQAHEETIHAMKFFDHITDRDGTVGLLDLKQEKTAWTSAEEIWKDAYAHEQFITSKIHAIMTVVRKEGDFSAEPMLNWFVNEQIEEELNTQKIWKQCQTMGKTKEGLFMLDRELAARIFPAGSPFDPLAYQQPAGV